MNRIIVEEVDEFSQKLNLYEFVSLCRSGVILSYYSVVIVVQAHEFHQQLVDLVCVLFALEKRKKHPFENLRLNYASFVLNEFIQLLSKVVEYA